MSINVMLIAKKRDIEFDDDNNITLSHSFCNFLCSPDAWENSDFEQIENILEIDLNILRRYPDSLAPIEGQYYYDIEMAKEKNDFQQVELLEAEFKKTVAEWEANYDTNFEGWTKIEEMENLINTLLQKIKANPDFYKLMDCDSGNDDYYHQDRKDKSNNPYKNIFIEDLQAILNWIALAKVQGVKYMGFDYI